jgi:conjugal transfer pilus assembly protein TraW
MTKVTLFTLVAFLLSLTLVLINCKAYASNFDVIGNVYEIKESSLLDDIMDRLKYLEDTGESEVLRKEFTNNVINSIDNPRGVFIPTSNEKTVHYFDPTFVLNEDILLPDNTVLHKAGTVFNPLSVVSLTKNYIFFDANDELQKAFAYKMYEASGWRDKVVIVNGSFRDVSNEWDRRVFFDQQGVPGQQKETLVRKFGIRALPSIVYQEGMLLKVESFTEIEMTNFIGE